MQLKTPAAPISSSPSDNAALRNPLKLDSNTQPDQTPLYLRKGLTKQNMDALYFLAHYLYEEEKYQEACPFFQMMTFLDNYDKRGWEGAAACLEATKQYSAAIGCYGCLSILDEENPLPFFRSFNCYLENNDKESAVMALEAAIEVASRQEGLYAELKAQAQKIKDALA